MYKELCVRSENFSTAIDEIRPFIIEIFNQDLVDYQGFTPLVENKKIFLQYWAQDLVPKEIEQAYSIWDEYLSNSEKIITQRFSKESAIEWLKINQPEFLKPFFNAVCPAMEADIFRIAWALTDSIIWMDSDHLPSNNNSFKKFNISSFEKWSMQSCSSFLLKNWRKGDAFINNSIFRADKKCVVIRNIANRIIENDSSKFNTRDLIASYAGPRAFTREISKIFLSNRVVKINLCADRQMKIFNEDNEFLFEIGDLFCFLGGRNDYEVFENKAEWDYKKSPLMNWQLFGKCV